MDADRRISARAAEVSAVRTWTRSRRASGIDGRAASLPVRMINASQPAIPRRARTAARATGRLPAELSTTISLRFAVGAKRVRSTPAGTREKAPGKRSCARASASSPVASSVSIRASRRSRWLRRGGYPSRSGSTNVAAVVVSDSSSATYESPGMAGSKPWTTSKSPRRSAVATFARTPTGIPTAARGETGTARATATTPSSSPRWRARRPAIRSDDREDGASTTTRCPRPRSASATPATCSFVSYGTDHACGVTRQMRSATAAGL